MKKTLKITLISVVSLIVIAIAAILIAGGAFLKPAYLEPWNKSYARKFSDPRLQLAAHGLLAANGHNMQPWIIKLDADQNVFYLYADSTRLTPEVDPFARQQMITQGTFLEYVRVAGLKFGYKTDIELFPAGEYDEHNLIDSMNNRPVAKITIAKTEPQDNALYDFIFTPDTNRAAYRKTEPTVKQIADLQAANTFKNISLQFYQDKNNLDKLSAYAMAGAKIESGVHRISAESANVFRANEYQKNKYRYGFSVEGQGTTGIIKPVLQGLVTLMPSLNGEKSSAALFVRSTQAEVDNTPVYAMIVTADNSRILQVESGMLYSRLVLTAHAQGFVQQPLSQVLEEYPEMAEQYNQVHADYAPGNGTIQMFYRMGQPTKPFPLSMRRDVTDLIK
jgi:hypothetical protein